MRVQKIDKVEKLYGVINGETYESEKNIVVTNPPYLYKIYTAIVVVFIVLAIAFTILTPSPHTAMYVCFTIFVYIPGTIVALGAKVFRIKVEGTRISVRKRFGFYTYNFDVSDITSVDLLASDPQFNEVNGITIYTSKGHKVVIGVLMTNLDEMAEFIKENVEETKLKKIYKSIE